MTQSITSYAHDGLTFDVLDEGPRDGEVVVLLHGWPQLNTCWSEVVLPLHAAGYRTIAPNLRGFAAGARPRGRWNYRMSKLVGDIDALIEEIGSPVHLVGHDWGAAIAWAVAVEHPDKIRTLTAVSVPHPSAFLKAMPKGQLKESWYMAAFNVPFVPERILGDLQRAKLALKVKAKMPPEAFETYVNDFMGDRALRSAAFGVYRGVPFTNPRAFGPVTVPTTYIWSNDDVALIREGAEMCGDYVTGDYRFEVIEGATHWLPDEEPKRIAELILERIRT
jgi:pimeloyl-ACP methyl ester carboxylesterase